MTSSAVVVRQLRRCYGDHEALRGVDLTVPTGSVLGLLGPNGAGKTTLVRILATLLAPTSGTAEVAGCDVVRDAAEVRRRIALAGQYAAVDELLSGRANLELIGRLRHLGSRAARARATELLTEFDLLEAADRPISAYSGGMRRRLDLAACLVVTPAVLFLDEPTTGLDPVSRQALWSAVQGLVQQRVTVVLTTQYLEEADALADQVVVIDDGRVIAAGTPSELKSRAGADRIVVDLAEAAHWDIALGIARAESEQDPTVDPRRLRITVDSASPLHTLARLGDSLAACAIPVRHLALRPPSLDEVFVELLGASAEAATDSGRTRPRPPVAQG